MEVKHSYLYPTMYESILWNYLRGIAFTRCYNYNILQKVPQFLYNIHGWKQKNHNIMWRFWKKKKFERFLFQRCNGHIIKKNGQSLLNITLVKERYNVFGNKCWFIISLCIKAFRRDHNVCTIWSQTYDGKQCYKIWERFVNIVSGVEYQCVHKMFSHNIYLCKTKWIKFNNYCKKREASK